MNSAHKVADRPTAAGTRSRPSTTSRRFGYVVAVVVNALLLSLVNGSPGWEAVPFLTDDTPRVLGLVNACLVAGVVANSLYAVLDPPWLRALGDLVTTSVGLAALVRLWTVFPIDVAPSVLDWELVARWVIGVGIGGSVIGIVVALARLLGARAHAREHDRP